MENITVTEHIIPNYIDAGVETIWGTTREQANGAQECIFNPGDVPLTITIAPGTGVFVRQKEQTE